MSPEDYVHRVDSALGDLPWGMRRELVSELRGHLDELPADTDLEARLGAPEQYAADLRSAAGLERRRGPIAFLRARRPRTAILAMVVLVVIGLALVGAAWAQSYQPLGFSGSVVLPRDAKSDLTVNGISHSAGFHNGRPFELGVQVQNNGRFTVRVLGVPYSSEVPWLSGTLPWSARLLMATETAVPLPPTLAGHGARGWHQGPFRAFRPFDLEPGQSAFLLLKGVFANCHLMISAGTIPLTAFPVRYSFLWKTATAQIPLAGGLTIVPPNNPRVGCG
ncbi:MAG TPA: hypothetical protein VH541_09630 [Gaiellaceae bacterium]